MLDFSAELQAYRQLSARVTARLNRSIRQLTQHIVIYLVASLLVNIFIALGFVALPYNYETVGSLLALNSLADAGWVFWSVALLAHAGIVVFERVRARPQRAALIDDEIARQAKTAALLADDADLHWRLDHAAQQRAQMLSVMVGFAVINPLITLFSVLTVDSSLLPPYVSAIPLAALVIAFWLVARGRWRAFDQEQLDDVRIALAEQTDFAKPKRGAVVSLSTLLDDATLRDATLAD